MTDEGEGRFPIACAFNGGPSADATLLHVEVTTFDGRVTRFAIPVDNVKHVVAFLLAWTGAISAERPDANALDRVAGESVLPIPATSVAVGEPNGSEGYIGISVGRAELVFSLPLAAFGPLGQTLLMTAGPASCVPS
jgi:hypothetical protein